MGMSNVLKLCYYFPFTFSSFFFPHSWFNSRSQLDIVTDERDHLKDDITEANQRNTKLAQEVDDRHNDIQKTNEQQLK